MLTYDMEKRGKETKFSFLYRSIKEDLQSGRVIPGEKMPSKRSLAEHLGISVITVENVYGILAAEGYLESRERSGYYVCESFFTPEKKARQKKEAPPPLPRDPDAFRFSAYQKIMRQVLSERGACLYERVPSQGLSVLREAIAEHLFSYRGVEADPDRIVVGSGAEYLYGLIAQLFEKGTVFGIEDPSYERIRKVYEAHGVPLEYLELDESGIASRALKKTAAKVLHVSPYHSFPTGVSATPQKRREYMEWARKNGAVLIEDDFDSEFSLAPKPLEPLFSMAGGKNVIYLNTFSKSLAPSARLGYMILPDEWWEQYEKKLGFYSCTVPAFDQEVLARYLSEGHFERRLNRIRRNLRKEKNEA